ncbi:AAA family ATPase [Vibrio sp. CK2-1]|uniref:AAA family ATPase n=1 Tax=Vibrio sp. CK2-1 TaxID=2912249 RepID=UPI001F172DCE|nr:AAA family ATPase [Vibrio sp. CK2-1]MCF7353604.1 AAA family ATPase [Vibrio sp. CK2-1]
MSMTHDGAHMVQLESQTDILDGLQMFTRLDSNVIYVEGEKGSGKSWLAQRFLNTDKKIQTLSFLICLPTQTAEQQRSVLLGQLLSDSFCTGEETLLESLSVFRKDQDCKATIIVDDANLLAEHLLDELAQLVLAAQQNPLWQISVILFTKPNEIDESSLNTDPKPEFKRLTISPLTDSEATDFIDQFVIPVAHIDSDKKKQAIHRAAQSVVKYPANLLALSESHKKPVVCWVKRSLIALIIILLALGGWSWWTSYQARVQDQQTETDVIEQNEVKQDAADTLPNQVSSATDTTSGAQSTLDAEQPQEDDTLPQAVTDKTLTVGDESDSEQKRVVVPSKVVDALLDGDSPKDAKVSNDEVTSAQASSVQNTGSSLKDDQLTLADDALLALPAERYTLQLAAVTKQEEAVNFIKMYDLDGQVRVYRTLRNQQSWYIVTYQDFASIKETRDAAQELSLALQKEQPWPKSIAQVHQEIERAK